MGLSGNAIRLKIERYCAYQERCQSEVISKLTSMGVPYYGALEIVAELIQANFINEERFAEAYVSGKFRIKGWGREKIRKRLREKKISDYCINKGLNCIDSEEYEHRARLYAESKLSKLGSKSFENKGKLHRYLYNKGFETDLINNILSDLFGKNSIPG